MRLIRFFYNFSFWASVSGLLLLVFDFGFPHSGSVQFFLNNTYFIILVIGLMATALRYFAGRLRRFNWRWKVIVFDLLSEIFIGGIVFLHFRALSRGEEQWMGDSYTLGKIAVFLTFVREFSDRKIDFKRTALNPAQLFIISFFCLIAAGGILLMLPNATGKGISIVDALFTATSAVCVTGLTVVDTSTHFTPFGQMIILILIQIGGLGILTFTSYSSYFFKGGTSYENQLTLKEITSSEKIGQVFSILKYVILITATVEGIATLLIYLNLEKEVLPLFSDRLFFSAFHAVSAFCNAGFSTITDNFYNIKFRYNYGLHTVIAFTLILGGLGFPIVVNILSYARYKISRLFLGRRKNHRPWVLNINSRITLTTTLSITFVSFILFFILEYGNTLANHHGLGKVVTAFFSAACPRTAGFNSVNLTALGFPIVMITILLMWVGASPFSTGGGIKTSTIAIAMLNVLSLAKGKTRIEVFTREIADISVRRAFATIFLSLIVIGIGILLIAIWEPQKKLLQIAFECFSAYSTAGLSLGITSTLSVPSKVVLIAIMFIGRVSALSVIIAIFKQVKHKGYRWPTEEITIN